MLFISRVGLAVSKVLQIVEPRLSNLKRSSLVRGLKFILRKVLYENMLCALTIIDILRNTELCSFFLRSANHEGNLLNTFLGISKFQTSNPGYRRILEKYVF